MGLVSESAVVVSASAVLVSESLRVAESWLVSDSAVLVTDSVVLDTVVSADPFNIVPFFVCTRFAGKGLTGRADSSTTVYTASKHTCMAFFTKILASSRRPFLRTVFPPLAAFLACACGFGEVLVPRVLTDMPPARTSVNHEYSAHCRPDAACGLINTTFARHDLARLTASRRNSQMRPIAAGLDSDIQDAAAIFPCSYSTC